MRLRLSAYLRAHRKDILVVFGALIVFIGFVVKDAVRDRLRDSVDSLEKAEMDYVNEGQHLAISSALDSAEHNKEADDLPKTSPAVRNRNDPVFRFDVRTAKEDLGLLDSELNLTENLINVLKPSELLDYKDSFDPGDLDDFRKQAKELRERWVNIRKSVDFENMAIDKADDMASSLLVDLDELAGEVQNYSSDLLEEAQKIEAKRVRKYEIATYSSYGLFVVGWILALIGKLSGVDIPGGS
jgi:hypothetical protein